MTKNSSLISEYYDRYWSTDRSYNPDSTLATLIRDSATPAARCLDVGCGSGNSYGRFVAKHVASYVGVDVSAAAVEAARQNGLEAMVVADAAELPFADATFDVVLCIEVFEHLFSPDRAAFEIHRVLRPGGKLIASTPNAAYWRLRLNALRGLWNPGGDELSIDQPWRDPHIRFFSPATMRRMLERVGFAEVTTGAHGGMFLDHLTSRPTNFGRSQAYQFVERFFPSLLGLTIHAVATK